MKVTIFTSDKHAWLLGGFFHQWDKYVVNDTGLEVEVAGFTPPEHLPSWASFHSIGRFENYPIEKWSDALIKYLEQLPEKIFMLMLEDYWLIRKVNLNALQVAYQIMNEEEDVVRFDVAADRMFGKSHFYLRSVGQIDICEGRGAYALSTQASLFNRDLLLKLIRKGETPWQVELNGTNRLMKTPYRVLGTYNWPVNYMIVVNKGQFDRQGNWMFPARSLREADWRELDNLGLTRHPEAVQA